MPGCEVWDDSQIVYPMRFAATHGFTEVHPWPVEPTARTQHRSQSTKGPVSLFVHGSREPFMGIWNPHTQTGTVHYADTSSCRQRRSGRGAWTQTDSTGAKPSPTTTAPMSKCRPDCFATRKHTRSWSRGRPYTSPNTGCRCGRSAESLGRIWRGWQASAVKGTHWWQDLTPTNPFPCDRLGSQWEGAGSSRESRPAPERARPSYLTENQHTNEIHHRDSGFKGHNRPSPN